MKRILRHNPLEPGGRMTVTTATLRKLINTIQEIITTDPLNKINLETKEQMGEMEAIRTITT